MLRIVYEGCLQLFTPAAEKVWGCPFRPGGSARFRRCLCPGIDFTA
ncbi:hypothetical protein [Alkalicoccus saliphilus]|nr:hypothetical protein [Alkalicoccus saliphilus]